MNIVRFLEVNKPCNIVFAGKPFHKLILVLINTPFKVVGHAGVNDPRSACHDVNIIFFHDPSRLCHSEGA